MVACVQFKKLFQICLLCFCLLFQYGDGESCDYSFEVEVGKQSYIYSPGYPKIYYGPDFNNKCRWIATCPSGFVCNLKCLLDMPFSQYCSGDRVIISKTGDPALNGGEAFCGSKQIDVSSESNVVAVGLLVTSPQPGGKFLCNVTAVTKRCSCGLKRNNVKIVNGKETGINEYPMMVGLGHIALQRIFCGGVIISPYYVLTAAHCLHPGFGSPKLKPSDFVVIAGEHDITTAYETDATAVYLVNKYQIHEKFRASDARLHDIAIVTTLRPISFSDRVGPACLPLYLNFDLTGYNLILLGWGTLSYGGLESDVLRGVQVKAITNYQCSREMFSNIYMNSKVLCTETKGKDACQGDSGGPALLQNPNNGLIYTVGIISGGNGCDGYTPAVHTRITAYLDWILANTPSAEYCRV